MGLKYEGLYVLLQSHPQSILPYKAWLRIDITVALYKLHNLLLVTVLCRHNPADLLDLQKPGLSKMMLHQTS